MPETFLLQPSHEITANEHPRVFADKDRILVVDGTQLTALCPLCCGVRGFYIPPTMGMDERERYAYEMSKQRCRCDAEVTREALVSEKVIGLLEGIEHELTTMNPLYK